MNDLTPRRDPLLEELLAFGPVKVWSVLVTILGDLTLKPGTYVTGPILSGLTSRIGVKPEAQRVALHRLKKDGWIEVKKVGRVSHYALSAYGRQETNAVQDRVFSRDAEMPTTCTLMVFEDGASPAEQPGLIKVGNSVFVSETPLPAVANALQVIADLTGLPGWMRKAILPEEVTVGYSDLLSCLQRYEASRADLPDYDKSVIHFLILHWWRRLVLSHSPHQARLMGADWAGHECRQVTLVWLEELRASVKS